MRVFPRDPRRADRLRRAVFAVTVVLSAAVAAGWLASYHVGGYVGYAVGGRSVGVDSYFGQMAVAYHWTRSQPRRPGFFKWVGPTWRLTAKGIGPRGRLGFDLTRTTWPAFAIYEFWFPHWFALALCLLAALAAGRWVRTGRRALRRERGLCATCGYDLRASPARCPECGAAAATPGEGELGREIRTGLTAANETRPDPS